MVSFVQASVLFPKLQLETSLYAFIMLCCSALKISMLNIIIMLNFRKKDCGENVMLFIQNNSLHVAGKIRRTGSLKCIYE